MNTTASGGKQNRSAYSANLQTKGHSGTSCSFCWFVMSTYPTLKGMTPTDGVAFSVHLKKTHGLRPEILA
jgi:hypothetical protein